VRAIAHPALEMSGTTLSDSVLGTKYFLTPDAAWLFLQLQQEARIEYLVLTVAREQHIAQAEAKKAVYTLLGLLNDFGGVYVYWDDSFSGLLRLRTRSAWRRRYPASLIGFAVSMWRAYGIGTAAAVMLFMVCHILFGQAYSIWWSMAPAFLFMTCVFHEAGHALAAQAKGIPFVFLARPGFAAIMYRRPAKQKARLVALFGPLTAVLFCVIAASAPVPVALRCLLAVAGIIHACSLLPFLADGRTLWRNT
jgi:hypothetical protein